MKLLPYDKEAYEQARKLEWSAALSEAWRQAKRSATHQARANAKEVHAFREKKKAHTRSKTKTAVQIEAMQFAAEHQKDVEKLRASAQEQLVEAEALAQGMGASKARALARVLYNARQARIDEALQ
jgi:hypothetical protein